MTDHAASPTIPTIRATGNEAYTHAPLMPLIAGYFVWEWRKELAALPIRASKQGLAFLVFAAAVVLLGRVSLLFLLTGGVADARPYHLWGWGSQVLA
jgi:hypothetical protein